MSEIKRYDINGRPVRPGDLIRIYHYRDYRTCRHCYMHKLVVLVDDDLEVSPTGEYLYAVDILDVWRKNSLDDAHKHKMEAGDEFEIIDGMSRRVDGNLQTWYERPRVKHGKG